MAAFAAGCATLFASGPQEVTLNSNPAGATYRYGPFSGKTPATIEVPRKALASFATFSLQGYETTTVPVVTGIQGSTWWDILFPIGFVVDFVTGNANKVEIPTITADLTAKAGTPTAASSASNAAVPSQNLNASPANGK
jgi:hypothetical protein